MDPLSLTLIGTVIAGGTLAVTGFGAAATAAGVGHQMYQDHKKGRNHCQVRLKEPL